MKMFEKIEDLFPSGVRRVDGKQSGKTVVVMAAVHGNEQGGFIAIQKAIENVVIEKGTVYFIVGNPAALKQGVRYTEMNLNRAFIRGPLKDSALEISYERQRAKEIMKLLDSSDAMLDIHSVSNKQATPFIICEKEYFPLARQFPFPIISSGWNKVEPGSTDYYMSTADKPGICLECGYHDDPETEARAFYRE